MNFFKKKWVWAVLIGAGLFWFLYRRSNGGKTKAQELGLPGADQVAPTPITDAALAAVSAIYGSNAKPVA